MIAGVVDSELDPTVLLAVRGPTARERVFSFVIDTGDGGDLLMPQRLRAELELRWVRADVAELADGSRIEYRVFAAEVEWDGSVIQVAVDEADTTPLLGTRRLRGYELNMQFRPHGKVTLKRLPSKRSSKKRES